MSRELQEGAIYSLALTPYQYTAKRADQQKYGVAWVLLPEWPDNSLIGGPIAFVLPDGRLSVREGPTTYTIEQLNFTGRYKE